MKKIYFITLFLCFKALSCQSFKTVSDIKEYYNSNFSNFATLLSYTKQLDSLCPLGYSYRLNINDESVFTIYKLVDSTKGKDRVSYTLEKVYKPIFNEIYYYKESKGDLSDELIELLDNFKKLFKNFKNVHSIRIDQNNDIIVYVGKGKSYLFPLTKSLFEILSLHFIDSNLNDLLYNRKAGTLPQATTVKDNWYFIEEDEGHGIN